MRHVQEKFVRETFFRVENKENVFRFQAGYAVRDLRAEILVIERVANTYGI
jgi:hypothetical protein